MLSCSKTCQTSDLILQKHQKDSDCFVFVLHVWKYSTLKYSYKQTRAKTHTSFFGLALHPHTKADTFTCWQDVDAQSSICLIIFSKKDIWHNWVSIPAGLKLCARKLPEIKIQHEKSKRETKVDGDCYESANTEGVVILLSAMSQWVTQLGINCGVFIMTERGDNNVPARQVLNLLCCSCG